MKNGKLQYEDIILYIQEVSCRYKSENHKDKVAAAPSMMAFKKLVDTKIASEKKGRFDSEVRITSLGTQSEGAPVVCVAPEVGTVSKKCRMQDI